MGVVGSIYVVGSLNIVTFSCWSHGFIDKDVTTGTWLTALMQLDH